MPEALAPVIDSLHGLTDIPLRPMSIVSKPHQRPATPSTGPLPDYTLGTGENFLTPNDYTVIYDIKSVYTGGNTGATIGSKSGHVAIIGRALVAATDISEYATNVAPPTYNLNTIFASTVSPEPLCTFDDASTCSSGGDQGESTSISTASSALHRECKQTSSPAVPPLDTTASTSPRPTT